MTFRVVLVSDKFRSEALAMSDDGDFVAVGGRDKDHSLVLVYDADTMKKVIELSITYHFFLLFEKFSSCILFPFSFYVNVRSIALLQEISP